MLSGGLDSTLATKLVLEQGIEVEAVNYLTVFCPCTSRNNACSASRKAADQLGIKLRVVRLGLDYVELVKNPRYGYGQNMNPCLDCRIFMLKKAGDYMRQIGASFVITGEVLGERPMSQHRKAMDIVEQDSGLQGFILRPLCARLLEPTIPEKEGWIDRNKLLTISGRSRKPQIKLAEEKGINDYPSPGGGCLLTDPGFSRRLRDLFRHDSRTDSSIIEGIELLKIGRHFRPSDKAKIIVSRNEAENKKIKAYLQPGNLWLEAVDYLGPITLVRGQADRDVIGLAASFTARYSKAKQSAGVRVICRQFPDGQGEIITTLPVADEIYDRLRL